MSGAGPGGRSGRLPIILVGGFLGSGKTTLLKHRYLSASEPPTAAVINEFGSVGIDHLVVGEAAARTAAISGGCACCERLPALVATLRGLVEDRDRGAAEFDRVVIEASGLADPAPIVATVADDAVLRHRVAVQSVVVTVDAVNGLSDLDAQPEAANQVAVADELIITKADLVDPARLESLASALRLLSPGADASVATDGEVEPTPRWPATGGARPARGTEAHEHRESISAVSVRAESPLDWVAFSVWLSMLLHARGDDILRVKGVASIAGSGPVALNGVQRVLHPPEHLDGDATGGSRTDLVFVTRDVEPGLIERSMAAFQRIDGSTASTRVA